MNKAGRINIYDSQTPAYHRAFEVFLANTDQKVLAREWLKKLVKGLPSHRVFIDSGAGNGLVTEWFLDDFGRTIAIEPNRSLCNDLRMNCPGAEVLEGMILETDIPDSADLVLCSHVFYYIERKEWIRHLEKLVSWLDSGGVLVVIIQNHNTDCMRMLENFFGYRFNLSEIAGEFTKLHGNEYEAGMETVPADVVTEDLESAFIVAEFMLNLLPVSDPPPSSDLHDYICKNFASPGGGFRFSCDQDFLTIRRSFF